MKRFSAIFAAAFLGIAGYAEEPQSDFAKAQAELKARAPEDYAKIEKLAATDLNAALHEFRSTARKHNVKLPRPSFQRSRRQPTDGEWPGRGSRPGRGDRQRRGDRPGRGGTSPMLLLIADGKVRKAFPQEFDAINRELCAAEEKLEKLAERAGVKYPQDFTATLRKLRAAAPEKMAEIEQLAAEDPRRAFRELGELAREQGIGFAAPGGRGGRRGDDRGRGRGRDEIEKPEPRRINSVPIRKLREEFPEEMKRYEELRQEDPAAAKKLLLELNERLNKQRSGK